MKSLKIEVKGLVQGVGFRPFIYLLASKFSIFGEVFNDSSGVKIEIYADDLSCDKFIQAIRDELPPLARIDELSIAPSQRKFSEFKIITSKDAQKIAPILPDFAICDECKSEFYDPRNRRYHHPFINCTNCGPRFSIIRSLPYDRQNTTMAKFKMCDECQNEYENPLNRRYHAQPVACNECGAKVSLKSLDNEIKFSDFEAINECVRELKNGKIIAIKGIGGFHLVCNALNETAINSLRSRKNRPHKPFALMCKDEIMASNFAEFSQSELKLLNSNIKPIVLVKKNRNLPEILAPNLDKVGIFLAPTSLHLLLFEYTHFPLIATSANISGEPIIKNYDEVCLKLKNIADLVLDNDRDILNPSDDSIAFVCDGKTQWLRTSRGIKPKIIKSKFSQKSCFLAIGSELKNEFAIYKDGLIFSSPYIGDLKNTATFERFLSLVDMFKSVYELEFDFVVADLHPYFLHTKHFEKLGFKVRKVQHHYAHVLSVMFENDLQGEVLGFGFDGTGYGDDASIWGGEVFLADENGYERVAKFDPFLLVGGDNAIKNIYHLTYAILKKYQISAPKWEAKFDKIKLANLSKIISKNIGVQTNSLGRIFDAFASLVLGIETISYDAQAAMELESLYDESLDIAYKFDIENGIINYKNAFLNALADEPKVAATGFINGIADLILELALHHKKPVVLGGGVFQNRALLSKTISNLEKNSIKYYLPKDEPANDSAIAMGQIYYGLKFLSYNQKQKIRNHNE
ncbi:[NiFe] hydrogenase maturation protein HypF [Campylobacter iguaniorum]|uniref:Carbamoyltransferase n=1 Tax=Campylobacter iguaniorum TaxID=1244531 RepID=A0A076F9C6_9BACT|nr:carbamoyltransferase HypF [Campylobacter iguaniorum]AII14815.1 [NiFe] hydrogenase maturation protein HypF [Campylobacter iguaniorum]